MTPDLTTGEGGIGVLAIIARLKELGVPDDALRPAVEWAMIVNAGVDPKCWCSDCDDARRKVLLDADADNIWLMLNRFMILCPDCGNKRCPHATSHLNACTGSNEPGQAGSNYGGRS